jgi:hypothetical protein
MVAVPLGEEALGRVLADAKRTLAKAGVMRLVCELVH